MCRNHFGSSVCGYHLKTTHFFDLEDPTVLVKLEKTKLIFESLNELIVIDEIQRRPELFPFIRVLVDQDPQKKFLILGLASRELIRQSSESLAGRVAYIEVTPFSKQEVPGLFWRQKYARTILEQGILNLGFG